MRSPISARWRRTSPPRGRSSRSAPARIVTRNFFDVAKEIFRLVREAGDAGFESSVLTTLGLSATEAAAFVAANVSTTATDELPFEAVAGAGPPYRLRAAVTEAAAIALRLDGRFGGDRLRDDEEHPAAPRRRPPPAPPRRERPCNQGRGDCKRHAGRVGRSSSSPCADDRRRAHVGRRGTARA